MLVVDREFTTGDIEQRGGALKNRGQETPQFEFAGEVGQRVEQRLLLGGPIALRRVESRMVRILAKMTGDSGRS